MTENPLVARLKTSFTGFNLDVDLKLPGQGVSVIFGPSGSGKSTLLRCLAGLQRAEGQVMVGGNLWQDGRYFLPVHKRPLGYVFQNASLFPHLSVQANLEFGLKREPGSSPEILQHAVELLGIAHLLPRKPGNLSGGERQRVAIAQALALNPGVLMLDEPLAALDASRKREILPYLERLHRELQIPLLYITHDVEELTRLADYLVVLEQGRVLRSGPVGDVLADFSMARAQGDKAGTVIDARITQHNEHYHLARADFNGGEFWMPDNGCALGSDIRLSILARDVSIALQSPVGSSIINRLPARIEEVAKGDHAAIRWVKVSVGKQFLLCRMSARSLDELKLVRGLSVWVQVKSVNVVG